MYCSEIIKTTWLIFSEEVPSLLYYSHIPTAVVAVFLGIFVFLKNKNEITNRIFLMLNFFYSILIVFNLILWTNSNVEVISLVWIFTQTLFVIIPIFALYFFYVFVVKKDVSLTYRILWSLVIFSLSIIATTTANFKSFNINTCEPNITNLLFNIQNIIFVVVLFCLCFIYIKKIEMAHLLEHQRKENSLFFIGILTFILFFTVAWQVAENFDFFNIEGYGLFGMTILLGVISFIIVRFKAFDIKLIGSQALVWALIILIGSEFFFVTSVTNQILVAITLVLSAIVGLIIVRSVKKEIAQKEELEVANQNQQLLIRFITHQVKGFFTKSKMVFASLLEGDFGEVPEGVKNIAKDGLESDNKAVDMVQEVLNASSLRSGQVSYDFKEVDLVSLIKEISEKFKERMTQKGVVYEIELPNNPVVINADKTQITQVFKNLIDNACYYTLTGSVKISLSLNKEKVLFVVQDTGVGLTEKDKSVLFREGGRGEESLKFNINSTGYGLFIVKKIVEGHGGKIWAESAGRGHGSKFYVEIPIKVK